MKQILLLLILLLPCLFSAQNTIGGEKKIVPESEVIRQSAFVLAERERLLGHYDKAIELYKKFLYDNPDNDAAAYALARAYAAKDDLGNALDAIGKAVTQAPANPWYQILQADLFEKNGRIKDAIQVYESLTKRYPQTPSYFQQLAYLSVLSGDPQGGLKALEKLEKLSGVTESSAQSKHLIYVGLGEDKKAAAELQKLVDAYPEQLEYRHRLARFYEAIKEVSSARRVYEDILRRNPDDAVAKLAILEKPKDGSDAAYLASLQTLFANPQISIDGKVKEILPYFPKLDAGHDPSLTDKLLTLGAILEKAHPDDPKAWSLSGDLLYHANRPTEALEKYRRCIRLNPAVFSVWENTLSILREQKNYDELLQVAEQAMDAFPNQPKAYYFYGIAAIEKNKPDEALAALEQATVMTGNNGSLRLDLLNQTGLALLRKKDFAAAVACYETALAKGGDQHPAILEHYGDALYQNGEREKALQYWQKALNIRKSSELEQKIASGKL